MKKQSKEKRVLGGIGLVLITSALTLGVVHLFNNNNTNDNIILTKLVSVDTNTLVNKGTQAFDSSANAGREVITYSNEEEDYSFKLINCYKKVVSDDTSFEFSDYYNFSYFNAGVSPSISLYSNNDSISIVTIKGIDINYEDISFNLNLSKSEVFDDLDYSYLYKCDCNLLKGMFLKITSFDYYGIEQPSKDETKVDEQSSNDSTNTSSISSSVSN